MSSPIDPQLEEPLRRLFGHALEDELEDFTHVLNGFVNDGRFRDAMTPTYRIAAVVVVSLCEDREPVSDDYRRIAHRVVEMDEGTYGLTATEVENFFARVVFDGETIDSLMDPRRRRETSVHHHCKPARVSLGFRQR